MFFLRNANQFAKVWDVTVKEHYIDLRISTSEKLKDGSGFVSSTWFPRVIGHAMNSLKDVKAGDSIVIDDFKIAMEPYTDKDGNKKSAFRMLILNAHIDDGRRQATEPTTSPQPEVQNNQPAAEDECPF